YSTRSGETRRRGRVFEEADVARPAVVRCPRRKPIAVARLDERLRPWRARVDDGSALRPKRLELRRGFLGERAAVREDEKPPAIGGEETLGGDLARRHERRLDPDPRGRFRDVLGLEARRREERGKARIAKDRDGRARLGRRDPA